MSATLQDWLARIERRHPTEIELGLDRIRRVHGRLRLPRDAGTAVTVAGTNGKGSCAAYLEAIFEAAGFSTGVYTSPHLIRFNERIRVAGAPVDDAEIVAALERVESARADVSLTYFEYATLAALSIFARRGVDLCVLEVGMGGRLDAVNVVDAAVSVVTSIGLDHQGWLGNDREAIAREKAGVFRRDRPAVIGESDPPSSLSAAATQTGARLLQIGVDFGFERLEDGWRWHGCVCRHDELPLPRFGGAEQLANASCALAAAEQLGIVLRTDRAHIVEGLRNARLDGRLQRIAGERSWILDVAHNGEAALVLAAALGPFDGTTLAVIGLMDDKPVESVAAALDPVVDEWITVGDGTARAMPAAELARRIGSRVAAPVRHSRSLAEALEAAAGRAAGSDRILVTGSFRVVGPALDYLSQHA